MIKKHLVLIGLISSIFLLSIAILLYPGGTYSNKNAVGFNWFENYISNLFETKALNGTPNSSRYWAYVGMLLYSISCAVFFVNMSKKIPHKAFKIIIKYTGLLTMPFTFLIITPLHDLMLNISNFLFWNCIVTITVFIFNSKLNFFKLYCVFCLLIFFYAVLLHSTHNWDWLPIVQKINIISSIFLILWLEYFTEADDFSKTKSSKKENF